MRIRSFEMIDFLFRKKENECFEYFSNLGYRDLLKARDMILLMESYLLQSKKTAFYYRISQYDSTEAERVIAFFKGIIISELEKRRKSIIIRFMEWINWF